jgi:hypothetical protein
MQWLATTKESWLLILDNCDNVNIDFARYIPSRGSSVIITTRLTECQIHGAWKNIDDLGPESAVQLLLKASGLEFGDQRTLLPAAESIISVLGQHALALVHAGAYIKKQHCTLSGYVELFRDEQRRLLEFKPRQQASRYGNINTTFEVSAKALACSDQHGCHLALKLLEIIAFLDHEAVEEDVFRKAFDACHKLEGECRMVWKENEIQWFQSCAVSDAGATRITKHHDGYESLDRLGTMTDMSCSWRGAYRCSSKSEVQEHKSIGIVLQSRRTSMTPTRFPRQPRSMRSTRMMVKSTILTSGIATKFDQADSSNFRRARGSVPPAHALRTCLLSDSRTTRFQCIP